ncbi:MAG: hypothetical protein M3393_00680 [Actinomycetota bacterium]|nr:hypothetical protein [Actinomycetota bacterium]
MTRENFDRLFTVGSAAVLCGSHRTDVPPTPGSQRWGPSVCLRPDPQMAQTLAEMTDVAMEYAGPGHWPTGHSASSHFTVRVLDEFRTDLTPAHRDVIGYLGAIRRAAARSDDIWLRVSGVTLALGSVMAGAAPVDSCADTFAAALAEELGAAGRHEAVFDRPFWYCNLIHFTGPILAPGALVGWVGERRSLDLGLTSTRAELLDWSYDGAQMMPTVLG